jgi:hypothetical protein
LIFTRFGNVVLVVRRTSSDFGDLRIQDDSTPANPTTSYVFLLANLCYIHQPGQFGKSTGGVG